ncbi:hypothetical protein EYF80_067517 [Liparis tanakae]|uniref:Uncharacterized protein n=1 Tax=Liparis tanakae TaxID=230148 RepID=A0A4Z2E0W2_9TELE|nr:hypothetical protein EYF80_067517 [Liparis tanakae]
MEERSAWRLLPHLRGDASPVGVGGASRRLLGLTALHLYVVLLSLVSRPPDSRTVACAGVKNMMDVCVMDVCVMDVCVMDVCVIYLFILSVLYII